MSELKDYKVYTTINGGAWGYHYEPNPNKDQSDIKLNDKQVYLKKDVEKVIAEKDKEISELKEDLHAANEQVENLINSAFGIMLFQDKVNGNTCQELRYNKYKRCVAMSQEWRSYATFCGIQSSWYNNRGFGKTAEEYTWKECHAWRCVKRWLELAEQFKEAK